MPVSLNSKTFYAVKILFLCALILQTALLFTVAISWNQMDHVYLSNIWATKCSFDIFILSLNIYLYVKWKLDTEEIINDVAVQCSEI